MAEKVPQQEEQPKPYKSAFALFTDSKNLIMKNPQPFIILAVIPLLFALASDVKGPNTTGAFQFTFNAEAVTWVKFGAISLLGFAALAINVVVQFMMYVLTLRTAKGSKPSLDEVYNKTLKHFWQLLLLSILVGLTITAGIIALIVPGLIFLRRYLLSPYVMLDEDLKVLDAMKRSAELSKPHTGAVWGLIGVTILISFTSALPRVGNLIAVALTTLYSVAPALRYLELKKLSAN